MAVWFLPSPLRTPFTPPNNTTHSTRSRTIRNRTSARVSVPSLLYHEDDPVDPSKPWVWRTNLAETKPFWEDWFVGLSRKFLEARGGKLLLLAGTDRLDKELMIGQMQGGFILSLHSSLYSRWESVLPVMLIRRAGKYQLQVFPDAGHFIQEDQPTRTAQVLVDFYKRNDRSALVLPAKVADMQAFAAMKKGPGPGGQIAKPKGGSTGSLKR
jgi:protein phosphatase methylesterase 1